MSLFDHVSPKQLAVSADIVALALAEGRDADELNTLGNFMTAVGSIILSIAAQQQYLDALEAKQKEANKCFREQYKKD